jgi:membrane associated rhomboid family serine protease
MLVPLRARSSSALGTWRFLLVYFVSGKPACGLLVFSSPFAVTVGASGAIYGILGALLIFEFRATGTFAGWRSADRDQSRCPS